MKSMLLDFDIKLAATTLFCDNQSAIALASNPSHHRSTKHIDIRYHFIRDAIQNGVVKLQYVKTENQSADILTKGLPGPIHNRHMNSLGLQAAKLPINGLLLVSAGTKNAKPDSERNKPKRCFKCGEEGHQKKGCLQAAMPRKRVQKCFKCGDIGHLKLDCPRSRHKPSLAERMRKPTLKERITRTSLADKPINQLTPITSKFNIGVSAKKEKVEDWETEIPDWAWYEDDDEAYGVEGGVETGEAKGSVNADALQGLRDGGLREPVEKGKTVLTYT